ncbi:BA14K family protein [Rhizobium sp. NFR03]|uniref:BA14K family protein n=1 Tax=Rhizobium sp. NFR03 TaxID=1566263 RepID=UPI0008CDAE20|nr:BA14K family protein [Rhizobium sp. NFR03]SES11818.1 BA14K-like protein [Rhizobium sp. NFR03]
MKKIIIALVSLVTAFSGIGPASAMPLSKVQPVQTNSDVQQVRDRDRIIMRRHGGRDWHGGRNWRGDRNWRGHRNWRADRNWRYDRRYRDRRYYRDRGIGVPLGAFAAGAIIGGALNAQPRYARPAYTRTYGGNSHVAWCQARYRSYRAYDNTFQPYNGPRRQCNSPY